jgi:hypothetical protein
LSDGRWGEVGSTCANAGEWIHRDVGGVWFECFTLALAAVGSLVLHELWTKLVVAATTGFLTCVEEQSAASSARQ